MGGIFSIGTSALNAAYTALRTASNNVANANTPGYSRQVTVLRPAQGTFLAGSYLGQGVEVEAVRRVYSEFLTQQAHQAQANAAGADTRYAQLAQVSSLFADPTTGIGVSVDAFFAAIQDLTQRPGDAAARQALIGAATQLSARFNDVGGQLQEMRDGTDRQLRLELDKINQVAGEIADLNSSIALAQGAGMAPNALLDQRDAAIRRLNESVRVSTVTQSDGTLNLYLGSGIPLVVGSEANRVVWTVDPVDPGLARVGVASGSAVLPLDAAAIGGGKVGGLLTFRESDLPALENQLGRLAVSLTQAFNAQHRLGDDRNGNPGADLFTGAAPRAFAAPTNANPATTISAAFSDPAQLVASDYRIDYAGGNYTLTRLSDGTSWTQASSTFTQDGLTIALAGTPPADGDRFLIQPLRNAARDIGLATSDPTRIAAAAPLRAQVAGTNTGAVRVEDISVTAPRTAESVLKAAATLTFTGPNSYSITDGVTTVTGTYAEGVPISFNGWQLTLRGGAATADQIQISANVGGVGDNRNALKLAQLQAFTLSDGASLGAAFAQIVADIGADTRSAALYASAQTSIFDSALSAESAVSGVNLDEEASRLMQYQQQYQAAAKIVSIASSVFDEILGIGR